MDNDHTADVLENYVTPGLKKNVMTINEKRAHLASLGVKGEDAEKILAEIYAGEGES